MSGIELRDNTLFVDREPNRLDELAVGFSTILARFEVSHVFVAGYVSILAGRARSTEDIDVITENLDPETADELVSILTESGYWGPAIPLASFHETLAGGANIWVAPEDQITPHLEVKFPHDEFDSASLENSITANIDDETIPIGPLELQIAYKLSLGSQKDVEDAVHLYTLFEESLSEAHLETWVGRLGVEDEYDRLKRS